VTPDFMCQWANCDKTDTPIIVSEKDANERNRFCCAEHAALYLLRGANSLDRLRIRAIIEGWEAVS
jgi:hypothetical protein